MIGHLRNQCRATHPGIPSQGQPPELHPTDGIEGLAPETSSPNTNENQGEDAHVNENGPWTAVMSKRRSNKKDPQKPKPYSINNKPS